MRFLGISGMIGRAVLASLSMAAGAGLAQADSGTTLFIVDGSASMWGRLAPDNRAKIDVVREKLTDVLKSSPQSKVGVVSFGQRRADCTDAEVINAPDTAHDAAIDTLTRLNPRGRSPLANALRAAAGAIGPSRPAGVLVVGDGADNCAQDACKAASEFAKGAPGVAIQVIGVGVAPNEKPLLACVADTTGGRYFEVATSQELTSALDEGVKLAMLQSGAGTPQAQGPAAAPALPPPPAGASLRLAASLGKNGAPLKVPVKWRIFKAGETAVEAASEGQEVAVKVPAGDYDIEARLGTLVAREKVSVVPGSAQSIVIPLNGAHLTGHVSSAKGGMPLETAALSLSTEEGPVALVRGGTLDLYLAPAKYTMLAADGTARQSEDVTLAVGDDKTQDFVLRTGTIELGATADGSEPPKNVLFTVSEDDPYSPSGRREVARSRAAEAKFTLPAGTYYVSARLGKAEANERVALGIGDGAKRILNLPVAKLKAIALIGGKPAERGQGVTFRIDRVDGDKAEVERAMGPEVEINMPPGRYRLTAALPAFHLSAAKEITLEAGKTGEQQIDIVSGEITFSPPASSSLSAGEIYWEVVDATGDAVWRATGREAKALFAPGTYTLHIDARGKRKTTTFDIRPGESRTLEIGPG